jgi:Patatin-like phospholipase
MNTTAHTSRYCYLNASTGLDEIGIAISGGGVRAACLGLGALQVTEESGVLRRTRYISAVSGGSYTATAFVSARAQARRCPLPEGAVAPWSRGSPEEAHLRRNLRYLGEDWSDLFVGSTRYVLTLLVNLIPFVATIVLSGCVLGAAYRAAHLIAANDDVLSGRYGERRWAAAAAVAVVAVLVEARITSRRTERLTRRAALALVVGLLLPDVIAVSTRVLDTRTFDVSAVTRLGGFALGLVVIAVYVFRSQWTFSSRPLHRLLRQVLRFAFSVSMVAVLVLPLLLLTAQASQMAYGVTALAAAVALLVLLVCGVVIHANNTSLHRTYSRRLDRAYVVRTGMGTGNGQDPDEGVLRLSQIPLGDTHADGLPHLLICASVNLREDESAEGEGCASFVFSANYVGGAQTGEATPSALTAKLDAASLVAASGAVVAPNMGRYTSRASRIALALTNLRLGLWLPNPMEDRHPREPRGARPWRWFVNGWYEPGPLASWREALGDLSIRHRYVFVSDGGHWDNSGIVELLRRRCRTIFAVDASVDEHRLGNLLRMISLARSELGVEFEADGTLLESRSPVEKIRFSYPDDPVDSPTNYLILLRTHVSPEMPSDLIALATGGGAFPRHPTMDQFLHAREVDAYIALGRWLLQRGLAVADLLPSEAQVVAR